MAMHVHLLQVPNGPLLVSSAAPSGVPHVHTYVLMIGTAQRIHVTGPASSLKLSHYHDVSMPVPVMQPEVFQVLRTGPGVNVPQDPLGAVRFPAGKYPSAWRIQRRFPRVIAGQVAPGFEGWLGQDPQVESETAAGIGAVLPIAAGAGLVALVLFLATREQ